MVRLPRKFEGAFPPRPPDSDKRSVGTVSIVGGSPRYSHAPVIAGLGARAAGAGLISLAVPDFSRPAAGALLPEATFAELSEPGVRRPSADVTVVGMGLGASDASERIVETVLISGQERIVVDADGLLSLTRIGWRFGGGCGAILTPHEGEAARLLGCSRAEVAVDRTAAAVKIARLHHATVVLKGRGTVVVSEDGGRVYVNGTGNPVQALGGMGDLLAGVIGARWARIGDPFLAAASSVWMHGAAADAAVAARRDPSLAAIASEIGSIRVALENVRTWRSALRRVCRFLKKGRAE